MRRTKTLLAVTGITALAAAAPVALAASGTPTLKLTSTGLGKIITAKGDTMFAFTRDTANHDMCVKIKGCTGTWHPLLSSGKPMAGSGVNASLLSTIKLPNGKHQVTYNKHPLYIYSFAPKGTSYVDVTQFKGQWDALNSSGNAVN
jgi:predicted lipoprotein with Yx(FWY)xxD motif